VEEVQEVDRAPDRRVEEHALPSGEAARESPEVGDARVSHDQLGPRVGLHEPGQIVSDRRQTAAAVDEDRHAAVGRQLEHGRKPLVVQ
jgi:hypothetical protein